jgi:hypothetical protein
MRLRNALLGACLALPLAGWGGAALAQTDAVRTITVPAGAVVLILPSADAATGPVVVPGMPTRATAGPPAGDPLVRLIAEQDAMMNSMMAEVNAAFGAPMWPAQMDQMMRAAFSGLPVGPTGGAGAVLTQVSGGPGVCSERMTYVYPANGGKPRVTVTRSGDACGAFGVTGPRGVTQTMPSQPYAPSANPPSAIAPHGPHLWTISDPPREMVPTAAPRS